MTTNLLHLQFKQPYLVCKSVSDINIYATKIRDKDTRQRYATKIRDKDTRQRYACIMCSCMGCTMVCIAVNRYDSVVKDTIVLCLSIIDQSREQRIISYIVDLGEEMQKIMES